MKIKNDLGPEFANIKTLDILKEIGLTINVMVKDMNIFQMVTFITEIMIAEKFMEKAFTHGKMEKHMMVNGKTEWDMDTGFGKISKMISILDSGKWTWLMDTEHMNGQMVIGSKVIGVIPLDMVKDLMFSQMVMFISDSIFMVLLKEQDSTDGQTVTPIKEISKIIKNREKVYGRNLLRNQMILISM